MTKHINFGKDNADGRGRSCFVATGGLRNIGPMFGSHVDLPRKNPVGVESGTRHAEPIVLNGKICIKPVLWNCMGRKRPIVSKAANEKGGTTHDCCRLVPYRLATRKETQCSRVTSRTSGRSNQQLRALPLRIIQPQKEII